MTDTKNTRINEIEDEIALYYEEIKNMKAEITKLQKEKNAIKNKLWKQKNKEHTSEYNKANYQENKEHIKAKRNELFECECGISCLKTHKSRHLKSKYHINFMEAKTCEPVADA